MAFIDRVAVRSSVIWTNLCINFRRVLDDVPGWHYFFAVLTFLLTLPVSPIRILFTLFFRTVFATAIAKNIVCLLCYILGKRDNLTLLSKNVIIVSLRVAIRFDYPYKKRLARNFIWIRIHMFLLDSSPFSSVLRGHAGITSVIGQPKNSMNKDIGVRIPVS